ncbi:MAG: hypothetical protein ACFFDI_27745, partial [Promethearchaeota archaeon]
FMERVESKEEIPFSKKVLKKYVDELLKTSPSIAKEKCDICKRIPKHLHADLAAGESLPEIVSQLNDVLIFAYYKDKVKQCPICGRLYIYDYEYEFLVPRSEEDESLYQATPKAVNDLVTRFLKYHTFKKIIYCKGYLKIDY